MDKKGLIAPVSIIVLGFAFAMVCLGVFLTKGKSAKWINRKMKIGALLLTISVWSCNSSKDEDNGIVTCYVAYIENNVVLDAYTGDVLKIRLDTANVLNGYIYGVTESDFSFVIIDEHEVKVQQGILNPTDGHFDNTTEDLILN
ncbi:MAG: hypothetical protein HC831_05795 [Chloroflexia bacterium]|nr:hypothetical protein [Chloroflexia bacterium]